MKQELFRLRAGAGSGVTVHCVVALIRSWQQVGSSDFVSVHLVDGSVVGVVAYAFFPMRWYEGGLPMAVAIFIPPLFLLNVHFRGVQAETYLRVTPQEIYLRGNK